MCKGHIEPRLKKQRDTAGQPEQPDRDTTVTAAGQPYATQHENIPSVKQRVSTSKLDMLAGAAVSCKNHKLHAEPLSQQLPRNNLRDDLLTCICPMNQPRDLTCHHTAMHNITIYNCPAQRA